MLTSNIRIWLRVDVLVLELGDRVVLLIVVFGMAILRDFDRIGSSLVLITVPSQVIRQAPLVCLVLADTQVELLSPQPILW